MTISNPSGFGALSRPTAPEDEISAAANQIYRQMVAGEGMQGLADGTAMEPQLAENMYYFIPASPQASSAFEAGTLQDKSAKAVPSTSRKQDFPILQRNVNGRPLIWLDNSATTQKPGCVINALSQYYENYNSNVHRGAHQLAREATFGYENARGKVRRFIGASSPEEIVFVRGATEAINLVAHSWGIPNLRPGDELILTEMEHHSNIVPWQMIARKLGVKIKVAPINEKGELMMEQYERLFTPRTRLAAAAHVSNVLGTINPVRQMADIAHRHGALMLIDGAQSAPHMPINVQEIDADFFVFSGHKMYGPTGIGVLFGKQALLERMAPYQGGGGMIKDVSFKQTTYQNPPQKFEAGTVNIADAIGLGAAVDYLTQIGMDRIRQYEHALTKYLMDKLCAIPGIHLIGTAAEKTSVVSFIVSGTDSEGVARYLDGLGVAIRAGHHCAQPVLKHFGLQSSARASIGLYNTFEDLDVLVKATKDLASQ